MYVCMYGYIPSTYPLLSVYPSTHASVRLSHLSRSSVPFVCHLSIYPSIYPEEGEGERMTGRKIHPTHPSTPPFSRKSSMLRAGKISNLFSEEWMDGWISEWINRGEGEEKEKKCIFACIHQSIRKTCKVCVYIIYLQPELGIGDCCFR